MKIGNQPGPEPIPPEIRILSRVLIGHGCWEYQGGRDKNGYGRIGIGSKVDGTNRQSKAHRVLYEALYGAVGDLDLDHLCRNRACVNPSHLEPVSRRENLLRGKTIPAHNKAKTHCKNGHEFSVANTYIGPDGARSCRACKAERARARRKRCSA